MGWLAYCLPALLIAFLLPSAALGQTADSLTGTWHQLPGSFDSPVMSFDGHIVIFDKQWNRIFVHGGIHNYFLDGDASPYWFSYSLSTNSWASMGAVAGARHSHSVVHRPNFNQAIIFGGTIYYGSLKYNDTWSLQLSENPIWTKLDVQGELPPPRAGHCAVYDSRRDRMIIWGGFDGEDWAADPVPDDVWALSLSDSLAWSRLNVQGVKPSSRLHHAAVYDSTRDEMLVVSGTAFTGSADTVLALHLGTEPWWERLEVEGTPPTIYWDFGVHQYDKVSAFLDPFRDRIVVYNGHSSVWILDLNSPELVWKEVATSGGGPFGYFSADYDALTGTLYAQGYADQVWTFTLNEFVPVKFLSLEANWLDGTGVIHWAVADQNAETFGVYRQIGSAARQKLSDVPLTGHADYVFSDPAAPASGASYWVEAIARDGSTSWHGPAVLPPFSERAARPPFISPNPLQSNSVIHFELSRPGHVNATLYDLAGREIATPVNADYAAGPHEINWSAKGEKGRELRAGIYILRLTTPESSRSIKVSKLK